jgi:hypothetical protein
VVLARLEQGEEAHTAVRQLFRESLRVIGALIQCLDESNDQNYLICKIIRPSLSETYANFA